MFRQILAAWKAYIWHLTQLMCKLVAMLCSQFATLSCLQHGNSHSVFTVYLPQKYAIHVATDTVDVQISCHPVQLVAETALTTYFTTLYHSYSVATISHSVK